MLKRSVGLIACVLAISIASGQGYAKTEAKGYWCFTLAMSGSESSACTRSEAKCTSATEAARSMGASACSFQETAWSTRTKEGKTTTEYLFAKKEHCEQHQSMMGGPACKEIK